MWKCEKCGEQIEDQFDSCWKCTPVPGEQESSDLPAATRPRPTGITVLAALGFLNAAVILLLGIICLFGARAATALFNILSRLEKPEFPSSNFSSATYLTVLIFFLGAMVDYLLARGLWNLKNWARLVILALSIVDLVLGGSSFLGPFNLVVPSGPVVAILDRLCNFLVILYLVSPRVRDAFAPTAPLRKWLVPAAVALGLCSIGFDLYHSGPEIKAVQWHLRHGDRARVNGVSFPVYYWHTPNLAPDHQALAIEDRPGPLRSGDVGSYIQITGSEGMAGMLSVAQLIQRDIESDKKAGYTDEVFQLQVGKQTMNCTRRVLFSITIHCYGERPIHSVFFAGGDRSLDKFNRMMADARTE